MIRTDMRCLPGHKHLDLCLAVYRQMPSGMLSVEFLAKNMHVLYKKCIYRFLLICALILSYFDSAARISA